MYRLPRPQHTKCEKSRRRLSEMGSWSYTILIWRVEEEVAFVEDEQMGRSEQAALASLIQSSFYKASHRKTAASKASNILIPLLPISQHPRHQSQTPALLPPTITASALASALASPSSTFLITMIPVIFTKNSNARPMVANSGVLHTSLPSTSQEIMPCQT